MQPLIMGKAVALHPLAVVLAVAGGTMVAGIPGALFSVPALAMLRTQRPATSHPGPGKRIPHPCPPVPAARRGRTPGHRRPPERSQPCRGGWDAETSEHERSQPLTPVRIWRPPPAILSGPGRRAE